MTRPEERERGRAKQGRRARVVLGVLGGVGVIAAAALGASLLTPSPAECDEPGSCRALEPRLDDHAYLRALSLDLRGVVPTVEDYDALAGGRAPETFVDAWLGLSPGAPPPTEFAERVVRRHGALLWPSIDNVDRIFHFRRGLSRDTTTNIWDQSANDTRRTYRGAGVTCLDEPATFGPDGRPQTREVDGAQREGWVEVRPYWNPSTTIKVCAFDAQRAPVSAQGRDCASRAAIGDAGCGCGPDLAWCPTSDVRRAVLASFRGDVERRIAANILEDEPYHALLTSRRAFVNGALAHYWTQQRNSYDSVPLVPASIDVAALPDVGFGDAAWQEVELPAEHAGVLTAPAYLLRFQTNRARAARFYEAFLCQPFQPPDTGIAPDDPVAAQQPDVQLRPGCNYCHAQLEPAAAHWGRWTQQGGAYLDPADFPEFQAECAACRLDTATCPERCRLHYVTRALTPAEEPYLGRLRAYEFLRPEHRAYIEEGPRGLVRDGLADGRFTACATRRTAEWLVGRPLREDEEAWARDLALRFSASDFRYRELVRAIVTSETYRRAL